MKNALRISTMMMMVMVMITGELYLILHSLY